MPEEPLTPEQRARDEQVRRNIELAFGFGDLEEEEDPRDRRGVVQEDENARRRAEEAQMTAQELRLTRDLQAAGLL